MCPPRSGDSSQWWHYVPLMCLNGSKHHLDIKGPTTTPLTFILEVTRVELPPPIPLTRFQQRYIWTDSFLTFVGFQVSESSVSFHMLYVMWARVEQCSHRPMYIYILQTLTRAVGHKSLMTLSILFTTSLLMASSSGRGDMKLKKSMISSWRLERNQGETRHMGSCTEALKKKDKTGHICASNTCVLTDTEVSWNIVQNVRKYEWHAH